MLTKRHFLLWFAITLVAYVLCFAFIDKPIAQFFWQYHHQHWMQVVGRVSTWFAGSHLAVLGLVFLILGVLMKILDNPKAGRVGFFGLSIVAAMLITFVIKVLLGRYRPIEYFTHQLYGLHGMGLHHALQSTPSGHATGMFAIASALALLWRNLTWRLFWFALAIVITASRVILAAHYLGDVLVGAYIGITMPLLINRWFQVQQPLQQ